MENTGMMNSSETSRLIETIEELRMYEKKNLRINRFRLLCAALALIVCAVAAGYIFLNVRPTVRKINNMSETLTEAGNNINTVAEELQKIDFDQLNTSVQKIVKTSEDTVDEVYQSTLGLSELIHDAETAMEHINSVDYQKLNDGIQRLNEVLEPIAKYFRILH